MATSEQPSRLRAAARNLLIMLAALGIGLILLEVAVRALGITVPQADSWYPHEHLGWTDSPGHRYVYQVAGRPVAVEFNRLGFRDAEHALAKPPGTRRIAVLGDSFVAAVQVNLGETFPKLLQARLNRIDPAVSWEVLAFGVGDWGNAQQLIALERFALAHEPDLVLWQFFPLNDVCNNEISLAFRCKSMNDGYRPYLGAGDELTFLQPWRQRLRRGWRTFGHLDRWQLLQRNQRGLLELEAREKIPGPAGPVSALLATYLPAAEQPQSVRRAWRTTERLIDRVAASARDRRVALAAVLMPFRARLGESWERFKRATAMPAMERDAADRRLLARLAGQDVPGLALRECFEPEPDHAALYVDGHLSVAGHVVAERCLWEFLRAAELLR